MQISTRKFIASLFVPVRPQRCRLDICLSSSQKNRNSLAQAWVLPTLSVRPTSILPVPASTRTIKAATGAACTAFTILSLSLAVQPEKTKRTESAWPVNFRGHKIFSPVCAQMMMREIKITCRRVFQEYDQPRIVSARGARPGIGRCAALLARRTTALRRI